MPPFMGQGMCSGIRDARNLAWKLDLVLRGLAADRLLDSYQEERRPHGVDWTLISIEVGRLTGMTDPVEAAERDRRLKSGVVPPTPTAPVLGSGILQRSAKRHRLVGDLSLQGRVEREGTIDLFDNFYDPSGFAIITAVDDPRASLNPEQLSRARDSLCLYRLSARVLPARTHSTSTGPIGNFSMRTELSRSLGVCSHNGVVKHREASGSNVGGRPLDFSLIPYGSMAASAG
jgi:hypothetical protein